MKALINIIIYLLGILIFIAAVALVFLYFHPGVGKYPNSEKRKEYDYLSNYFNGKFQNLNETKTMSGNYTRKKNTTTKPKNRIKVIEVKEMPDSNEEDLLITWLGHSSNLLSFGGKNILIDPVLTEYSSPVSSIGPKRFSDIPLKIDNVKNVDVLLLSHDHYNHLDYPTIKGIDKEVKKYIVPLGVDSYLISFGVNKDKIITLNWWEEVNVDGLSITLTPSQHFSGRNPLKGNSTLWGGFYIKNKYHRVYYTGDSGYFDTFKEINNRLGEVELLMNDSAQYNAAWASIHMRPEEALQVAKDVNAKVLMPVHFGTFVLSDHNWYEPAEVVSSNEDNIEYVIPKLGQTFNINDYKDIDSSWWKEYK